LGDASEEKMWERSGDFKKFFASIFFAIHVSRETIPTIGNSSYFRALAAPDWSQPVTKSGDLACKSEANAGPYGP
jgi:hypothetical protein